MIVSFGAVTVTVAFAVFDRSWSGRAVMTAAPAWRPVTPPSTQSVAEMRTDIGRSSGHTARMAAKTPDVDPEETGEWIEALEGVLEREGPERAHFLVEQLIDRARRAIAWTRDFGEQIFSLSGNRENALVLGTYGRGLWVGDITPLQQLGTETPATGAAGTAAAGSLSTGVDTARSQACRWVW